MNKKYIIIKKYPRSQSVGTIIKRNGFCETYEEIQDNPEFLGEYFEEIKSPIFTTYDGVEKYAGDYYFRVDDKTLTIDKERYFVEDFNPTGICFGKVFSSAVKAEKYILLNKPKYSLNDIKKALIDAKKCSGHELEAVLFENLENE